ncbi:MAG TPA: carboxypeptidase-like regulatory domain-containing protein [Terracidiphilus sp.]|jgi:hypothetical protein
MRKAAGFCLLIAAVALGCIPMLAATAPDSTLAKATLLFGQPLNAEHHVFRLNDTWVIWLIEDVKGHLIQVDIGPQAYYSTEFPKAAKPSQPESLSQSEYDDAIERISKLKNLGMLRKRHTHSVPSVIGPLNTDVFDQAFVERIVSGTDDAKVSKFDIYFLHDVAASPEQIVDTGELSMVCFGDLWYYLPSKEAGKLVLGRWQILKVAGDAMRRAPGCVRTTTVRDADGFTIEHPQNELVVISDPYSTRELSGRVMFRDDSPVEAANVEFLRAGTKEVLRAKTDKTGAFRMPRTSEGHYKFMVTKDGYTALSGTVIVDKHASSKSALLFKLDVGT